MPDNRKPMSPVQFMLAMDRLKHKFPHLTVTSIYREGDPGKHGIHMAMDLKDYGRASTTIEIPDPTFVVLYARKELGLWGLYHEDSDGEGFHFHFQGIPPGPPSQEWIAALVERARVFNDFTNELMKYADKNP